jgi:hypothetical protein
MFKVSEAITMTNFIAYSRLSKKNGTVASICIFCQETVATGLNIIELVPSEIAHKCAIVQTVVNEYKELGRA